MVLAVAEGAPPGHNALAQEHVSFLSQIIVCHMDVVPLMYVPTSADRPWCIQHM